MVERLGHRLRPTGMRTSAVVVLLLAGSLLTGCGQGHVDDGGRGTFESSAACAEVSSRDDEVLVAHADLDGDGVRDPISYLPPTSDCAPSLSATVGGVERASTLDDDLPIGAKGAFAISVPGRVGEIAVLRQEHPRGGFQVVLFAWSSAGVSTLNVDDHPVFPFVATDVETTPLAARCVPDGFEITQARRHEPIGVVPAWDVDRTHYIVNGTTTIATPTTEIADNVLEADLRKKYRDLVDHSLFGNCRATG